MNAATTPGHTCGRSVSQGNAAVAMTMICLRCGGVTILLEPLEDPDEPSPPTKCYVELAKHMDISLGVDCHRLLVVVLKPEWLNDAMFGYADPGNAFHSVLWPLQTMFKGCTTPEDAIFRVNMT